MGFHLVPVGNDACDFCGARPVTKFYPCGNFIFNNLPIFEESTGVWGACSKCAELVDTNRYGELCERAFEKFVQKHGRVSRYQELPLREQFRELHRRFKDNIAGSVE